VFHDSMARAALTLRAPPGGSSAGASVRATAGTRDAPTRAEVSSPHGVTVVRAVAAIPGWSATWRASGTGVTRPLVVARADLVQAVTVPAGRGTVTWTYDPPGARLGLGISAGGVVAMLGLVAVVLVWRRRSRTTPQAPRSIAVVSPIRGGDSVDRAQGPLVGASLAVPAAHVRLPPQ
jgi:hypothetical protein